MKIKKINIFSPKIFPILFLVFFGFLGEARVANALWCSEVVCNLGDVRHGCTFWGKETTNCHAACSYDNCIIESCDVTCIESCPAPPAGLNVFSRTSDCNNGVIECCGSSAQCVDPAPSGTNVHCEPVAPPPPVNNLPYGWHDSADCNTILGWAVDNDCTNAGVSVCGGIYVHLYKDGPAGEGTFFAQVLANDSSPDVLAAGYGDGSNRFNYTTPDSLKDGLAHQIYAYAINYPSGDNPTLWGTPKTITCSLSPTADIKADGFDGPITIPYNTAANITWTSTNANSCTISPTGWTGTSGSQLTGNLTSSETYTLTCTGPGGSAFDSVTVSVGSASSLTFTADSTSVAYNTGTTLRWSSSNTTYCTASGDWSGSKSLSGSEDTGNLTSSKTYILTCGGPGGSVAKSVTVNVSVPPPGNFTLNTGGSVSCNSVPLSWTAASGTQAYRILRGSPRVDISPYQPYTAQNFIDTTVSQNTSYAYQIEAYNSSGTNRSNTINVSTPYCPPTVNLSGNPNSIFQGQSVTLSWATSYATSCIASGGWSGSKALNGNEVVVPLPPPSVTYNLTCSGSGGSASGSIIINITSLLLPNWREIIPR